MKLIELATISQQKTLASSPDEHSTERKPLDKTWTSNKQQRDDARKKRERALKPVKPRKTIKPTKPIKPRKPVK
jgi:hypothetical protein